MSFNSYTFIIFFGIVLAVNYLLLSLRFRKINLLIASYLFYGAWNPVLVVLPLISTTVDWFTSKRIYCESNKYRRYFFLGISLFVNLGMLSFFKYTGFIVKNVSYLLELLNIHYKAISPEIILPLGISFFTLQSLTYTLDIYRRKAKPWHSFLDFALYVCFFPKVANGPITRAFEFLPQAQKVGQGASSKIGWGFCLILIGLFEKVVVADGLLAPVADKVFGEMEVSNTLVAWAGALAFTGQIFCDFAGYSSCAIGVALCLGFELPSNFKYPYAAVGFSDFWRRWHISLSSWLRDYLYISLGGNRKGKIRTYLNLMATMLLGGLWHGASWTFVLWGGLHGLYLIFERLGKKIMPESPHWNRLPIRLLLGLLTFALVCIAWVLFRANTFEQAFIIFKAMFGCGLGRSAVRVEYFYILLTFAVMFVMLAAHWMVRDKPLKEIVEKMPWWVRSIGIAILLIAIVTCSGDDRAFIYFQF
jgi:D-alanyl-lipoteichoic acid acyltransferase DltB (MBOAT superfamily)